MTKDEFEIEYCKSSDITKEYYDSQFVTLPCNCGEEECSGWACVTNSKLSIGWHNELNNKNEKSKEKTKLPMAENRKPNVKLLEFVKDKLALHKFEINDEALEVMLNAIGEYIILEAEKSQ